MPRTRRTRLNRALTRRLDTIIDLPLARFRTAIKRLPTEELEALQARIEQMTVKQRWALGGHGMERHRAPLALELLGRRQAETHRESEARAEATSAQLRLIDLDTVRAIDVPEVMDQAA